MRLTRIARSIRRKWMRLRRRLRGYEAIEPGHMYRDVLTDERVLVQSVGPQVVFERQDAANDELVSASKDDVSVAMETGLLVHARRHCRRCPSV